MNHLLLIMRTAIILLFTCVFISVAETGHSQSAKVSLNKNNVNLKEVLNEIESQTDYLFIYNNQVNTDKTVSVNTDNTTVREVLTDVLKDSDIDFLMEGNHIILSYIEEKLREKDEEVVEVVQQQGKTITGTIVDEQGEPIIGANVIEKGTSNGTVTDFDGNFTLEVSEDAILRISYIGYLEQETDTQGKNSFNITLIEDTKTLDEVVVVGYGSMMKKDLTGSVSNVQGETIASRNTTQLSSALQGAVPGLMVTRDNNAPGATASIRVRGVTTIGDSNPLVIIDGVSGDINQVNANDVESISVLKDAASASIYGARAASGVILVTTKRAKVNELALSYNFEYGLEIPTTQPGYVDIKRFLEMTNELRYNDNNDGGWHQTYSQDEIDNWTKYNESDPNKYPITDWTDLILKKSAPRQTHSINIAGGTDLVRSKASFTYDKIDGLYADRNYERYMLRANNDFTINKFLGASLDFNFKRSKAHQPHYNPMGRMRVAAPVYSATWDDGRIAEGKTGANPYGQMKAGGTRDSWYNQIGGRASIDFTPLDGLKLSAVIAPEYNFDKTKDFRVKVPYYLAEDASVLGGYLENYTSTGLNEYRNDRYNITTQFLANYLKSFGLNNINALAGYESFYTFSESLGASRDQYDLDNYPYLDIGPLEFRDNSGNAYETAYQSVFGRIIYSHANKYLLQANIRYDGSSRFADGYRWGAFPSFSTGWVISEENFLQNTDWLSFLKLRASWGTLGNERIGNYPYQAVINFDNALFYKNGEPVSELTAAQWQYAIKNISWEKTKSFNFGLDATVLNNRLSFSADYYRKTTKDMLLALEIPDFIGFENPEKNTGRMNTNGYELDLTWNDQIGNFTYSVGFNFSDFISKMGDLGGTQFLGSQVKMEGSEFNEWFGYISDGLYLNQEDLDSSAKLNENIKIGDVKYKDISGPDGIPDGRISSEYDRVPLGGSLPRYMYGANIQMQYKYFDMAIVFQGVGKQNALLSSHMIQPLRENWGSIPEILDGNYWSAKLSEEENAQMKYPRLTYANAPANMTMSDFWLFNGRYLRLKNITLGYTFNSSFMHKVYLNSLRLYVSANDLFSIDKYPKGWDPEMGTHSYPITTSLIFGISVKF